MICRALQVWPEAKLECRCKCLCRWSGLGFALVSCDKEGPSLAFASGAVVHRTDWCEVWQCSGAGDVQKYLQFCKAARRPPRVSNRVFLQLTSLALHTSHMILCLLVAYCFCLLGIAACSSRRPWTMMLLFLHRQTVVSSPPDVSFASLCNLSELLAQALDTVVQAQDEAAPTSSEQFSACIVIAS